MYLMVLLSSSHCKVLAENEESSVVEADRVAWFLVPNNSTKALLDSQ